jgi:hypothetical protein
VATLVRGLGAAFLIAHGLAHLVGFVGSWRVASFGDVPYATTILGGTLEVGDVGIRIVGLLWVAAAISMIGAAVAAWRGRSRVVAAVAAFSLGVCLIGLPAAMVGVVIDLAILTTLARATLVRPRIQRQAVR